MARPMVYTLHIRGVIIQSSPENFLNEQARLALQKAAIHAIHGLKEAAEGWFYHVPRAKDMLILVPERQHHSSQPYTVGYRIRKTHDGHTIVLTWSARGLPESESDPMGEATLQLTLYEKKGRISAGYGNTFNVRAKPPAKERFGKHHLPPRKKERTAP